MNKKIMPLSCISLGVKAEIISINPACKNRDRLIELGFTKNTEIVPLHISPSGDPVAYSLRGAIMALRKEDADNIYISPKEEY